MILSKNERFQVSIVCKWQLITSQNVHENDISLFSFIEAWRRHRWQMRAFQVKLLLPFQHQRLTMRANIYRIRQYACLHIATSLRFHRAKKSGAHIRKTNPISTLIKFYSSQSRNLQWWRERLKTSTPASHSAAAWKRMVKVHRAELVSFDAYLTSIMLLGLVKWKTFFPQLVITYDCEKIS